MHHRWSWRAECKREDWVLAARNSTISKRRGHLHWKKIQQTTQTSQIQRWSTNSRKLTSTMQSKLFTTKKKNVKINLYVFLINYSNTVDDVNLKFLRGIKDICSFTACHHSILITSQQIFQFLHHSPESAE